ncbi:MAG: branched-chain amino acid aminotransferase [Chloroflexi bacterium]|nr:branched-chain amino acid aminotransferase [Chloroflexota bacterium]
MAMEVKKIKQSKIKKVDFSKLGFGDVFTDHMLAISYGKEHWLKPKIVPFGPIRLLPSLSTLHYGQAVFEGLKAFYAKDGSINIFRLDEHIDRFNRSCRRLCIPEVDKQTFKEGLVHLIKIDREWVPKQKGYSLYIRPFAFAADNNLGVHVSHTYRFFVILSPVGAYYKEGFNPVKLITAIEHARSVEGGMGAVKTAGNYAASLLAAHEALKKGFTQVLWLDGIHREYIEEVGTMNVFFHIGDELITPHLSGTILAGMTRASVIHLAKDWGMKVSERRLPIDEVIAAAEKGTLKEAFGTGTAAVISPIGLIQHKGKDIMVNKGKVGSLSLKLYDAITGIQYGEKPDKFGWVYNIK